MSSYIKSNKNDFTVIEKNCLSGSGCEDEEIRSPQ